MSMIFLCFFGCNREKTFLGNWSKQNNPCQEIVISSSGKSFVFEIKGQQFPAKVVDDILEIYAGDIIPARAVVNEKNELIILDEVYVRQNLTSTSELNGEWKVFDNGYFKQGSLSFEDNQVSIYYGTPIQIDGFIKKSDNNSYLIYYSQFNGSISIGNILENLKNSLVRESPIAKITKNHSCEFIFEWYGVDIGEGAKWLANLDDDDFWGTPLINESNVSQVVFKKEPIN